MTQQHPIAPPPELVQQWFDQAELATNRIHCLATRAAQWGANQELEACCEWLKAKHWIEPEFSDELRAARRPKPPSLKEQALDALTLLCKGPDATAFVTCRDTIRRALEQLPDHE